MKRGFTKIELLTVIAMIAILAAILFPVFAKARERARQSSCLGNLLNLGMALRLYAQDHDGRYPPQTDYLTPLYPRYVAMPQIFTCPSSPTGATMGQQLPPALSGNQASPGYGNPPSAPASPG